MTIEEMFRRIVRAHLSLIVVCALLPLVVAVGINLEKAPDWRAATRIQVASTAPKSSIEADGLSTRVLALATTPSMLDNALRSAGVSRDLRDFAAKHVTADRLGQSSVVQISVTDLDAAAAGRIATALATQVADFINKGGRARFDSALADLNKQIAQATDKRKKLAARLRRTHDITARANVQADISSADQALSKLAEERAALVLADATRDEAVVVGTITDVYKVPSELIPQAALALLLGLAVGLTTAAVLETVRPRVAGPRALARLLAAPVLGKANQPVATLKGAMALAARRQGVETIVLMGADERDNETIGRLLAELRPDKAGSSATNGSANSHTASQPMTSQDAVGTPTKATGAPIQTLEAASTAPNGSANSHTASQPTTGKAGSGDLWPAYPFGWARQTSTQEEQPAGNAFELDDATVLPVSKLRLTDLSAIRPEDEMTAGVVVVSSGTVLHHRLDNLDDVLKAVRWPVLGVIDALGKRRWGGSR